VVLVHLLSFSVELSPAGGPIFAPFGVATSSSRYNSAFCAGQTPGQLLHPSAGSTAARAPLDLIQELRVRGGAPDYQPSAAPERRQHAGSVETGEGDGRADALPRRVAITGEATAEDVEMDVDVVHGHEALESGGQDAFTTPARSRRASRRACAVGGCTGVARYGVLEETLRFCAEHKKAHHRWVVNTLLCRPPPAPPPSLPY